MASIALTIIIIYLHHHHLKQNKVQILTYVLLTIFTTHKEHKIIEV